MARTERWVVRVQGDDDALERLAGRLHVTGLSLCKVNADWHLTSSHFEQLDSSSHVEQAARDCLLPLMATYGLMLGCSNPNLRVHSVSEARPSGTQHSKTLHETMFATAGIACWGRDLEEPRDPAVEALLSPDLIEAAVELALSEPAVQRVFAEYTKCQPDADDRASRVDMRRTIECIVGGWGKLRNEAEKHHWLTGHECSVLDVYLHEEAASGENALHPDVNAAGPAKMAAKCVQQSEVTTADAHRLLRKLVVAYVRDQCNSSASSEKR